MNYDDGDHPSCYDLCTKTSYLYMMMQIHISKHTFISIATIFKRFLDVVGGYCGVAM